MPEFHDPWLPDPDSDGKVPPVRRAIPIVVCRVNATEGDGETDPTDISYQELPNVACVSIEEREGPIPSTALFRYKFSSKYPDGPQSAEEALSTTVTTANLSQLVEVGDRLAVRAQRPDGNWFWIFDGFPLTWSATLHRGAETVTMAAVGVAKRCWDEPLPGAIWRDSDEPEAINDTATDLVAQFNPRGLPNACPGTADSGDGDYKYPVFMDPGIVGEDVDSNAFPRVWTLPMAAAYILFTANADELWIKNNINRLGLNELLISREPIPGTPFDPNDDATYTAKSFAAPDTPLTGRDWPTVLYGLVKDAGFGMRFDLTNDVNSDPTTSVELYLKQGGEAKPLLLQEEGATFKPAETNLGAAELSRDLTSVVNRWVVMGAQARFEASFILAPGFPAAQADSADAAALAVFRTSDPSFNSGANHDKYRLWVFDEAGESHYQNNYTTGPTTAVDSTATTLDLVLGAPVSGVEQYAIRRRPPHGTLATLDDNGKPLSYRLSISTDYSAAYPLKWDGSGTWQAVQGGYELLKDRIGVYLNEADVNGWKVGKGAVIPGGVVKVVECIGNPSAVGAGTPNPTFWLRLTAVIEGDKALQGVAEHATTSPVANIITRQVDARDRYIFQAISAHSENNTTGAQVTVRDDTALAKAEAIGLRTATEAGVMAGQAMIPRFTRAYQIGDRISGIQGRDLGLRTDTGGPGFAPVLPMITARRWELEGQQRTFLEMSDSGLDRRRYSRSTAAPKPGGYT